MFAVIFEAEIAEMDAEYTAMAQRMRQLAMNKYGCQRFVACAEAGRELAISYWQNEAQISAWKQDPEHLRAQVAGKNRWYKSYRVQVVEVVREYESV